MNIRKAESNDLDIIYGFICVHENKVFDYELFKGIFEENLVITDYVYYVAELHGKVVGFISFHTQKLSHHY